MILFGKRLSDYTAFCRMFLIVIPVIGIARLALSLGGAPNSTARWLSNVPVPFINFSKGIANIASDRKSIAGQSFDDIDVLLLPTTTTTTPTIKDAGNPQALSAENTMFANYYGLPAVSVPCGFDRHGLPLGLQIVAKPWDDGAVLRLAHQFQTATEFTKERRA